MEARLSLVTLGVSDLPRARKFYEAGLGWRASSASNEHVVFFSLGPVALGLFGRRSLAEDAHVPDTAPGFSGLTLAHNVRTKAEVAQVLALAERAGARILKPAQDVFWGGHSGYFADPDGHLWEVAWNPLFPLNERGEMQLP